jgi:hypothetical protein
MPRRSCGTFHRESLPDVAAGHDDPAGGGPLLTQDQPQEGRLARAGCPYEEHELPRPDVNADVVQSGSVAFVVALGDALERDHFPPCSDDWLSV